ncbi:MAG: hypothetical protein [Bacteriophage sp.]|nr:MAG: hypothetical protein [Bacteriophage sp.]
MDYEYQTPLGDNILAQIAATARQIVDQKKAVAAKEAELKEEQNKLKMLQEEALPELMKDAGQQKLTTADGLVVEVKDVIRGTPTKEREAEAFQWLRDHGQGGIIKSRIEADLGKVPQERIRAALDALLGLGFQSRTKQTVHWQSLAAMVKELMERGEDVPLDVLGVHIYTQAEVKPKG